MTITMADYALHFIGTPYKLGGNVPQDGGIDCSGFILEVLRAFGKWGLGDDTAHGIRNAFKKDCVSDAGVMQLEGALLFWGTPDKITHVSMALGNGMMIEAGGNDATGMVRIRPTAWRKDFVAGAIIS